MKGVLKMTKSKKNLTIIICAALCICVIFVALTRLNSSEATDNTEMEISLDIPIADNEIFLGLTGDLQVSDSKDFENIMEVSIKQMENEHIVADISVTVPNSEDTQNMDTLYIKIPKYYVGMTLAEPIQVSGIDDGVLQNSEEEVITSGNDNAIIINYNGSAWSTIQSVRENGVDSNGITTVTITISPVGSQTSAPSNVVLEIDGQLYSAEIHNRYVTATRELRFTSLVFSIPNDAELNWNTAKLNISELRDVREGFVVPYYPDAVTE